MMDSPWPLYTLVLMDTRRHTTMQLPCVPVRLIQPAEVRVAGRRQIVNVEFAPTGDHLYGDPIYYQVKGPELPDTWWAGVRSEQPWRAEVRVVEGRR